MTNRIIRMVNTVWTGRAMDVWLRKLARFFGNTTPFMVTVCMVKRSPTLWELPMEANSVLQCCRYEPLHFRQLFSFRCWGGWESYSELQERLVTGETQELGHHWSSFQRRQLGSNRGKGGAGGGNYLIPKFSESNKPAFQAEPFLSLSLCL